MIVGPLSRHFYFFFLIAMILVPSLGHAQTTLEHQLIRRLVVFPVKVPPAGSVAASSAQNEIEAAGEDAWWQAREDLAASRRFLVASKQFLIRSDVFQSRGDLEPADAIILGKLLDAHALITLQLLNRRLLMSVFDGGNGMVLWKKGVSLHPSLTVKDQLPKLAKKIVDDFTASLPYQGFTVVDALVGKPVYQEGDVKLAQVDLGVTTGAQIGDTVQWIKLMGRSMTPLFQGGGRMIVFAEGKIVRLDQGIATTEIVRAANLKDLKEFSLVRVPREADRLQAAFTLQDSPRTTLSPDLLSPEASPMERVSKERKPLLTTLSFVVSLVGFLLLAF